MLGWSHRAADLLMCWAAALHPVLHRALNHRDAFSPPLALCKHYLALLLLWFLQYHNSAFKQNNRLYFNFFFSPPTPGPETKARSESQTDPFFLGFLKPVTNNSPEQTAIVWRKLERNCHLLLCTETRAFESPYYYYGTWAVMFLLNCFGQPTYSPESK